MRVVAKERIAEDVVALTLAGEAGGRLPDWTPGSHIDLVLPDGTVRQYSLCGDRWDPYTYRIGVLREPDGRGGSAWVHDRLEVGDAVGLGGPRNNFPLAPAERYLFVAGGIGIAKGSARAPELLAWVIAQCDRSMLSPDGFGAAIWAAADRGELTEAQAPLVVRSLLSAGVDTRVHALSAVLYAFATHPDQWQRLRERPSLARVAFDEAVRWESPVQTFFRTAATDVPVEDTVIPDCKKILMFLGVANRDPRRWAEPDRFDLGRDPSGHVGFGMGLHQCVGQHIARLEAEAVLTALARRVSHLGLAGPVRRHHNGTLRAWASIPLRLTA
jgi:hypothetical protein